MAIRTHSVTVTTTGSAGSATGTGTTEHIVNGRLLAIHLNFHASAPATTDTTITCAHTSKNSSPTQTVLTITNSKTDAWYYPRVQIDDDTGSAVAATYDHAPLDGYVTVTLAQADALTGAVVALILVDE